MVFQGLTKEDGIRAILLAGGAGFIGSHIVRYLLGQKDIEKVLVVDNFVTGTRKNLTGLVNDDRLEVLDRDITDPMVIKEVGKGFDLILHLATIANQKDYEEHPVETLKVNSEGSQNMIEIARRNKAKYVFFSSSEVYGSYDPALSAPFSESTPSRIVLNQKRSPYVVGKCFGEEMTINLCRREGVEYLIIRPFNIYGPNMDMMTDYGRVIPNFCIWGLRGMPLRINGDGSQERSFCHVDDLINALVSLLKRHISGQCINIGYPRSISILDLARLVSEVLSIEEDFQYVDRYPFEPNMRLPDIGLIGQLAGWEPVIDLRSGLVRTIEWFKIEGLEYYGKIP